MINMDVWSFIKAKLKKDKQIVLMVVIDSSGSSPGRRGFKMAVDSDGKMIGSIGGGLMEYNLVEFAKKEDSKIIVRGLRAVSDFEYELQMSYANQSLDNEIDTIYLMPTLNNAFISSSIVRNILSYNGDISHLIPKEIENYLK